MPDYAAWIAELLQEREREESAAKEAARVHLQRVERIDAAISDIHRLAADLGSPVDLAAHVQGELIPVATLSVKATKRPPLWQWAARAYEAVGLPMRMPALVREIQKLGGPAIARESLRTIVKGKDDVFQDFGDAYYGLRRWPLEETKQKKLEGY